MFIHKARDHMHTTQGTIVRLENELIIVGLQQVENSLHPSSGGSPVSETSYIIKLS